MGVQLDEHGCIKSNHMCRSSDPKPFFITLCCAGRRPYYNGLGLEDAGVQLDERGRIKVDHNFKTTADGIFAIGDVIHGPMLAHKVGMWDTS